ncbi:MAG TPA: hypothetical protein VGM07_17105 [Stellaceae bacterium]|jgi:hypothetical protein
MPRIICAAGITAPTLDDLRKYPGRLVLTHELRAMGIAPSYDTLSNAVKDGRLPKPYKLGQRLAWEGRDVLKMIGASPEIPGDEPLKT